MPVAFIALGSNLGDRAATLTQSLRAIAQSPDITLLAQSQFHETEPLGGPAGQQCYLNAAAKLETNLSPTELLARLLAIEQQFGRTRHGRNAPRTLDLDLLLFDERVHWDDPILPHPRMHEREFVLGPLSEIASNVVHPILKLAIADLLKRLKLGQSLQLDGLRAMVTGSTRGIGRAIAFAFVNAGADVIVHGRSASPDVMDSITRLGSKAVAMQADLRNEASCDRLVDEAWSHWGGLDIWVNNAGADVLSSEAADWSYGKKLETLFEVDVRATIQMSRAIGERMRKHGGVILNIGWDQADTGMEGDSGELFAASKGAVMAFTKSLAVSLAPTVRVNCIAPGWIKTAWGESASAKWQKRVVDETPLRRWGLPEDVAATSVWLASPAASFITGQVIYVNGGAVR